MVFGFPFFIFLDFLIFWGGVLGSGEVTFLDFLCCHDDID
jgi:hypothetical protein